MLTFKIDGKMEEITAYWKIVINYCLVNSQIKLNQQYIQSIFSKTFFFISRDSSDLELKETF